MKTRNWKPHKSNQEFVTHSIAQCTGRPCCVHNPSDHHMRDWPQHYRIDNGVTERICSHGVGHPDPDQTWPKDDPHWVHGCDGCCSPEREIPKGDGTPLRFVLDEPTPPFPEIPQELLDDPSFQMLSVGNPKTYSCPVDYMLTPPSFDPNAVKVNVAIAHHTHRELALGFLRYEALRKLHPRQFSELHARNLAGENFDEMVTKLVFQKP